MVGWWAVFWAWLWWADWAESGLFALSQTLACLPRHDFIIPGMKLCVREREVQVCVCASGVQAGCYCQLPIAYCQLPVASWANAHGSARSGRGKERVSPAPVSANSDTHAGLYKSRVYLTYRYLQVESRAYSPPPRAS
jgi:hypothetical protein